MQTDSSDSMPDPHADKYNDPRVKITRRGIWMGVGVFVLAIIGAGLSIYIRKTPIEKTREFWGQETVTALQLAERIELLARGNETFENVDLTTTPGLGHLRRALLDERNYDWDTQEIDSVDSACVASKDESLGCIQLRFTDPTGNRIGTIEIDIDLASGWVGPADGSKRVRTSRYVQPKLRNYFATVINFKEKRYDFR